MTLGDPGGATAWGITLANFTAWRRTHGIKVTTKNDLYSAKQSDLSPIYNAWFWNAVHGDSMPIGVDLLMFDFGVTAGPGTAHRRVAGATRHRARWPNRAGDAWSHRCIRHLA